MSYRPTNNNESDVCEILSNCVIEIKNWMAANLLQLNTDKTELNIFGTRQMLLNLRKTNCNIAGDIIDVTSYAKDTLSMICKESFNGIRNISTIRNHLMA